MHLSYSPDTRGNPLRAELLLVCAEARTGRLFQYKPAFAGRVATIASCLSEKRHFLEGDLGP